MQKLLLLTFLLCSTKTFNIFFTRLWIVLYSRAQKLQTVHVVILKPDKGNGIVILDRTAYDNGLLSIINDSSKFKPISKDPTLTREGRLERFLRDLRKQGKLENDLYDGIYPNGSQLARVYGLNA